MIIGLVLSVAGLYLAFRKLDPSELMDILAQANGWWILVGAALLVFAVWLRAVRWGILMRSIRSMRLTPLFSATMIGYFGNGVFPLRLGELLRAYAIHKEEESISTASAFGTIVVERFLDLGGLLMLTIVVFSQYPVPSWLRCAGIILAVIVVGGALLFWGLSFSHRDWLDRMKRHALFQNRMGVKIYYLVHSFTQGLVVLRESSRIGVLAFYTALLWLFYMVVTKASALALGIPLSWIEVGVILVATTMVISIPSAPGFVGTYHAAAVLIMQELFGKSEIESQAYSILNHAVGFVPLVAIGFAFLLRSSVRLGEIRSLQIPTDQV